MIKITNVSKTFYQKGIPFKALDSVNLNVAEGEIIGIIGSSGAGKSTLIRCINLLEKPDSGKIVVHDIDLMQLSSKQLEKERKKIGMIFQHFNLLSSRTVFENVALPLELDKTPKSEIKEKVDRLLDIVDLREKLSEYPKNLSGGQKQRVAIARALANDPHLLLCDEATSALDPATTLSILRLLRDINKRLNITILLITHEMEVVKTICDHIAVIDHGQLVVSGTLEQLLTENRHPILNQFIHTNSLSLPQELHKRLRPEQAKGLFPLVEIELDGNLSVDKLTSAIEKGAGVPYKTIKANIEYLGSGSFGKLMLQLRGTGEDNEKVFRYLNENNIKNNIIGYA